MRSVLEEFGLTLSEFISGGLVIAVFSFILINFSSIAEFILQVMLG